MKRAYLNKINVFLVIMGILFFLLKTQSVLSWGPIDNYRNYSVRTTVNVTEAYPVVLNITCDEDSIITLEAGVAHVVSCIVELVDYNGGDTINGTNGSTINSTLFYHLNLSDDPDDNNTHYTNNSCTPGTPSGFYVNWTCDFPVWYYANNGSWYVNASILDTHNQRNITSYGVFNVSIDPLYALNVTDVIDYGDLAVGETSASSVQANVTNFGNMEINVSVYAYGGDDSSYDSVAMICDVGNISMASEHFSLNASADFDGMEVISNSPQTLANLSVSKQVLSDVLVVNSTYWRLHVNVSDNPYGVCNGTVIFSALSSI